MYMKSSNGSLADNIATWTTPNDLVWITTLLANIDKMFMWILKCPDGDITLDLQTGMKEKARHSSCPSGMSR